MLRAPIQPLNHDQKAYLYDLSTKVDELSVSDGPADHVTVVADNLRKLYGPLPPGAEVIFRAIHRHNFRVTRTKGPAGVYVIPGPSGSGKTFFAQKLGHALHRREDNSVLMVNAVDYQDDTEFRKLVGAPPSYMGHRETPPVFSPKAFQDVRSKHSNLAIIVIDEIERAGARLLQLLLPATDENNGTITLGDNTVLSFKDTLILMPSNVGSEVYENDSILGLTDTRVRMQSGMRSAKDVEAKLIKLFGRVVFKRISRLGGVIPFPTMSHERILHVIDRNVRNAVKQFNQSPYFALKAAGVGITEHWKDQFLKRYDIKNGIREGLGGIDVEVTDVLLDHMERLDTEPGATHYDVVLEELGKVTVKQKRMEE